MIKKKGFFATAFEEIMRFLDKGYKDNIAALAGQSAFFLILSAAPLLMFAFSLISMLTGLDINSVEGAVLENIELFKAFPFAYYIVRFIEASIGHAGSGVAIITAVMALWSAGRGLYCITEGITRIYELPNKHIWLTKRLISMLYTAAMLLAFLLDVALLAANIFFADTLSDYFGVSWLREVLLVLIYIAFGLLLSFLMALALKLYLRARVEEKKYRSLRALMPGMLLTVLAWNLMTFGVAFYIRNFATSSIYGSLGTIFVLMMWIYFLMYILLAGIELNYIYRDTLCLKAAERKLLKAEKKKQQEEQQEEQQKEQQEEHQEEQQEEQQEEAE